ncbi:MAG: aldehyde ferredoxin oxidoreductase family protein [Chloroflexota bacterium]|nr:MAG: aldehyde ferredoxin oxidoreductase family protein [Chloroflexota bacterium]
MTNQILRIDLSNRSYRIEEVPDKIIRQYIGGRGLGAYLLYNSVPPRIDPLDERNHLIFTAGPSNGTNLSYSSKTTVNTKSPLTGIYLYAMSSGTIGHQIRKAGLWAIDVTGIADSPTYLVISNEKVEFKDATSVWGTEPWEAQRAMLGALSARKAATMAIGPAGERVLRYAAIMVDGPIYRAFGRGGSGCVMGSKKLKGIVVHGDREIEVGDREGFERIRKDIVGRVKENKKWADSWRRYGTRGNFDTLNKLGLLPTRNWQGGTFEAAEKLSFPSHEKEWTWQNRACGPFCPTPCASYMEVEKGAYQGAHCDGPEYETIYAFGPNCGVDKLEAIIAADQICDENGIDTMSAGASIGFAMECFENGLIGIKDTDGIELRFGDDKAMIAMLKKIVSQEGFGLLLSEGVRRASKEIKGSESFAMHVKGLELGGYECRGANGQALQFAINNRGGCHHGYGWIAIVEALDGTRLKVEGKGEQVKNIAINQVLSDSIPCCVFGRRVFGPIDENVSSLFGKAWSFNELKEAGTRIICQERLFNMREGITREDDALPGRLLNEPKPDGPTKGEVIPLEELKDGYYHALGWDLSTGNPGDSPLDKLGINS